MHQEKIQKLEKAMALPGISADEKAIYAKAIAKLKSEATPAGKKPCADDCHECHDCKEKKAKAAPPKNEIDEVAKKYGWKFKDGKLYNRMDKAVAEVSVSKGRYKVNHVGGETLATGSKSAIDKVIKEYFYGKEIDQPAPDTVDPKEINKIWIKDNNFKFGDYELKGRGPGGSHRILLYGKDIADFYYDHDSNSFIVNIDGIDGEKMFDEVSDIVNYFKNKFSCQILDKDGKPDISPAAVKQLEECAENLPQTKEKYFKDGKYTTERKALHDKIIKSFKKDKPCVDDSREPVCILTGGPPGSGKSTWLAKYLPWATKDRVYHIDADEVRAMLPEYKGWNATSTHVETKDIVNRLIDEIGKPCEYDLIYDGTMNKATSYDALVDKIRKLGYKVFIIYISVPKKVSEQRVLERYRKRGRYVPKLVIDEVYEKGLTAFEKLAKEADGYIHVDGESGKIVDKGGMPLPDGKRFEKPTAKPEAAKPAAPAAPKKGKGETREELKAKAKTREELVADAEKQMDKIKSMSESQVIEFGLKFNAQRGTATALKDGLGDNKARLSPTPENLIRWMRNPGKFDLIGVDTFERTDPTKDYKKEISIQKFWNNIFGIKHNIS